MRQWRTAGAAISLMGDSGLRREEAAHAWRQDLRPIRHVALAVAGGKAVEGAAIDVKIWALTVVGKRRRQRAVPVSAATIRALRVHWIDRGDDFDAAADDMPLISLTVIPTTLTARAKHGNGNLPVDNNEREQVKKAYAPDALARLVRQGIQQLAGELLRDGALSHDAHTQLLETSAHAFRHTFGTRAVARDMPIDVVQTILGHPSLSTTSIYVKAEQKRMLEATANYYRQM